MKEHSTPQEVISTSLLTSRHQAVVATVTLACLLAIGCYWVREYQRRGRPINVERVYPASTPHLVVDVNRAPWYELTLLPGISETMARRIVVFRQTNGPFRSSADVQRVKGIGPRTFARLEPYLAVTAPRNKADSQ